MTPESSKAMYLQVVIFGQAITGLIDFGASATVMSEACARRIGLKCNELSDRTFHGAGGGILRTLGKRDTIIYVIWKGVYVPVEIEILVLHYLKTDLILGMNFLERSGLRVDFKTKQITLESDHKPIAMAPVRVQTPKILQPYTSAFIKTCCDYLEEGIGNDSILLITGNPSAEQNRIYPPKDGSSLDIMVSNFSNVPIELKKEDQVALFSGDEEAIWTRSKDISSFSNSTRPIVTNVGEILVGDKLTANQSLQL